MSKWNYGRTLEEPGSEAPPPNTPHGMKTTGPCGVSTALLNSYTDRADGGGPAHAPSFARGWSVPNKNASVPPESVPRGSAPKTALTVLPRASVLLPWLQGKRAVSGVGR